MYKRLQNQSTTCCNRQLEPHMIFCPMCGNKVNQSIAVNDITGQLSIFKSSETVSNDNEYYIQDRYFLGYALSSMKLKIQFDLLITPFIMDLEDHDSIDLNLRADRLEECINRYEIKNVTSIRKAVFILNV